MLVAVGELRRRHACSLECAEEFVFLLKEILPTGNNCPASFSANFLALQSKDLDIRRSHCCPCDHHVYEDTSQKVCPVCDESRYKEVSGPDGNARRPRKVNSPCSGCAFTCLSLIYVLRLQIFFYIGIESRFRLMFKDQNFSHYMRYHERREKMAGFCFCHTAVFFTNAGSCRPTS